ncbi:hypothetical protein Bcsk_002360 [Bartonella sp. CDC_skunk]|uniref:hypothetical protein n=1 Tax=unclassified Bartonella TaxID=2645622 RepID=UPI0009C3D55C|nr:MULTISPECIES: hypothetical protein [unclassified Bartonella]AQX20896.1 hypothetical protein Bcsk_002360 [Bartonella sp. CDC_skunk]AQX26152.1 hypothetical protein Bra60_001300 [Bartonella sp. Raccoon60]
MTKNLHSLWDNLCDYVRNVGKSDDLSLLLNTERSLVENDLLRYANSQGMISSLKTAIAEIDVVKDHIKIVSNSETYDVINRGYSLPKNRKGSLPYDEARQAMASHYARLGNWDKARLTDIEKSILKVRRENIKVMQKLYEKMQAKAIGIDL